ncbi:MAG: hypothetical protein AAGF11_41330 [Myxococcota bacterium]
MSAAKSIASPVVVHYAQELPTEVPVAARGTRTIVILDYSDGSSGGTCAATNELTVLNRRRDTLRENEDLSLVIVLPLRGRVLFANEAPDLWSIRSSTVVLPPPSFSTQTLQQLREWTQRSRAAFEAKVEVRPGAHERYRHGIYSFAYQLDVRDSAYPLERLRETMWQVQGWTGWPPWWVPSNNNVPYSADPGTLECWMLAGEEMFPDPAHSDFWRASVSGRSYLLRGYEEDSNPDRLEPGTRLSRSLPIWRTGEALNHAAQMAEKLSANASPIYFIARWEGIRGRRMISWPSHNDYLRTSEGTEAAQAQVESSVLTDREEIKLALPRVVERLARPLYDAFLEEPDITFIETHIDKMRTNPAR